MQECVCGGTKLPTSLQKGPGPIIFSERTLKDFHYATLPQVSITFQ